VSTREELIKLIAGGATCGSSYHCGPLAEDLKDAAEELDAFVHGLAEQQRSWWAAREAEERQQHGSVDPETRFAGEAVSEAADLIDPEEQQ
jgi:hypothetical protein